MKTFLSIYKNSRIVKEIVNRIVLIELACFLAILSLSIAVLRPLLNRQSTYMAGEMNTYMANIVNSTFESMITASQYMASSAELHRAIEKYDAEKTDQAYRNVRLTLNRLASCQPSIRGVVLESQERIRFNSITNLSEQDQNALGGEWYQMLGNADYGQKFFVLQSESVTFLYAKTIYIGSARYIITLLYNADTILDGIRQYSRSMFSGFAFADHSQNILYLDGNTNVFESGLPVAVSGNTAATRGGMFFINPIQSNMWKLISHADKSAIGMTYRSYLLVTVFLFVLLCVLTVLLVTPAVYKRIDPINTLSAAMGQVAGGDLRPAPEISINNEIGDLSRIFNHMVDRLNEHIGRIIEHEKAEQKMRYSLLISQIDPHFIYNTMNILNTLARDNRMDDIIEINTALIKILQDRLRVNGIQVFDCVAHEVDIVKKYLLIQQCRYKNDVAVTWLVDNTLLDLQIPKNIIQPLVENALFHGLIDELTGELRGTLNIEVAFEKDDFIIRVSDSGRGIEPERVQEIMEGFVQNEENRGRHIGLGNIYGRLKYLFNRNCYMHIDGNCGTVVTIGIKRDAL